mgnify:CR=1 FL=1
MSESHAPRFIHLRLHTEYSLVDGIVRVPPVTIATRPIVQTFPVRSVRSRIVSGRLGGKRGQPATGSELMEVLVNLKR